ncbi:MAG TPA: citrate synthase family protein [Polyangiaceae bacterium]|nr:citrate synthase family protein [Polyangiaceae bacterium]
MSSYLTAAAAAQRLGVTRATLYAYVSRGQIRGRSVAGRREREYLAEDVERLLKRASGRRDPARVASQALGMEGLPVLTSGLSLIESGELYYRGKNALELAANERFEAVAGLLWGGACELEPPLHIPKANARARLARLHFARAAQCYLVGAEALDPTAYLASPEAVRRSGARILYGLTLVATGQPSAPASVAAALCRAWGLSERAALRAIEQALILCADHELNVSAFTARAIASAGATPYMAVSGALAALTGHRHGGMTARVAALLDEAGDPTRRIVERLRVGESVPGFGHALYPDGDPRARRLLELCPKNPARERCMAFARAGERLLGERPVLDFGLVALARSLGLPASGPFVLFALGRSAGWIAHCLEQYALGQLIRPRAQYTGPRPQ